MPDGDRRGSRVYRRPSQRKESLLGIKSEFVGWNNDSASSHSSHSKRLTLKENAVPGPKRGKFPTSRNLLICSGMVNRKPFLRASCQRGSAREMVGCQFPGRDRRSEIYGFTWTLASPVTSCIGRCCESFAFCCAIEITEEPGAIPLTTRPSNVPLPLTPAVFGCRVAAMID
jgi:hypothetical protein